MEPVEREIIKEVPIKIDLASKIEKYMRLYERNNEQRLMKQSVFRVLFYNWSLNQMISKLRSKSSGEIKFINIYLLNESYLVLNCIHDSNCQM